MENNFLLGFLIGVILLQLVTIILLLLNLLKSRRTPRNVYRDVPQGEHDTETCMLPLVQINEHINDDNFPQAIEIDQFRLEMDQIIGEGEFFRGNLARLTHGMDETKWLNVYVKSVRNCYDVSQSDQLKIELKLLCELGQHPNVQTMIGYVKKGERISIVKEYLDFGDLRKFVRNFQSSGFINQKTGGAGSSYTVENPVLDSNMSSLSTMDLLSSAYQISNGMEYLAQVPKIVHRDLALRNILLASDKTIRIGDFCLARKLSNENWYREENTELSYPICHMDPCSIFSMQFSEKSDVWSFAVCLFELFSLGETPYEGVDNLVPFLESGARLAQPKYCHDEIYQLMSMCWNSEPSLRPTFSSCVEFFKTHFETHNLKLLDQIKTKLREVSESQENLSNWAGKTRKIQKL